MGEELFIEILRYFTTYRCLFDFFMVLSTIPLPLQKGSD